jgi:hypothetical protein
MRPFDIPLAIAIALALAYYVLRHLRSRKTASAELEHEG